jgi:hypothetical protein
LEVALEPFSEGFGFGGSGDYLQQCYGFFFGGDDSHKPLVTKESLQAV